MLFRLLLKLVALSVAAVALYASLLDPNTKPDDRTWLLLTGLFFLVLLLGSFVTNKYVELPVGVVLLLIAIQGATTGRISSPFRWHHNPIDINTEPGLFWLAMVFVVLGALAVLWHAYHQHKKDTANNRIHGAPPPTRRRS